MASWPLGDRERKRLGFLRKHSVLLGKGLEIINITIISGQPFGVINMTSRESSVSEVSSSTELAPTRCG